MVTDLADKISEYLQAHRSRSLKGLSMKTGVAYATLRRIYQKDATPTLENTLRLIQFICPKEEALRFLKMHYADFGEWLDNYFSIDQVVATPNLNALIKDKDNFIIISLASTEHGTTLQDIANLLGSMGCTKTQSLLGQGILIEEHGVIKTAQKEFACVDADSVLAQIRNAVDCFNKDHLGTSTATAVIQTDGVSDEGLRHIFEVIREADRRITKIRKNHPGRNTMFAGLFMNIFEGSR